ncbi:DMT family transporter [Reinekea blandensis]|uniref:EamA domain-containing protein n=1 Tax=Reinekea blandensis MED297 TaxID=314283 RepID=A4BDA8_9GAMM|nr:DMT family transporter [Reinekea blandensis]EAR09852.1 hypothetical protein MED297_05869 [Reinekea sp. MED297] [Reinekea blandensis MED297]
MEYLGYLAALGAAASWACAGLLSVGPVRQLGPIPFNALRMLMVASLLTLWLTFTDHWSWPSRDSFGILMLSGFVGIFLGDTLLFTAVKILGPRMAGLLFATNAPLTFIIGILIFKETYTLLNLLGVLGVIGGVFIAISSRANAGKHHWEQSVGHVGLGLLAGFGAATCQSLGVVLIANLLTDGQDPVFATMLRVWVAVICLFLTLLLFPRFTGGFRPYRSLTPRLTGRLFLSGFMGMALGMSLYLTSVSLAPMGIVTILSATTPVILLPIAWLITAERPHNRSLYAAILVVMGAALIFTNGG